MKAKADKEDPAEAINRNPIRLWPGIIIVMLQWLVRFGIPIVAPKAMIVGIFGGLLGGLALAIWWTFFSRAARIERWGAIVLIIVTFFATTFFLDVSIATANMGLMFIIYSIPVMCLAFVIWAVVTRSYSDKIRRVTMIMTVILAFGLWIFLRTNGMTGDGRHDLAWRWAQTDEDRLLAQSGNELPVEPSAKTGIAAGADWIGFRGTNRDGIVRSTRIRTDWSVSPPVEIWREPIGPGCSSFAVHGNLLYTQEQRGEYETVSCYNLTDGKPVWKHQDKARFYDSHAGAGPRSTPALAGSSVYTLGATGILNALNISDGSVKWSRNAASDAGVKVLPWGFAGSPLIVNDVVIVALSGKLAAYDTLSGNPRWFGPDGGSSYSSPQLLTINGISQTLLMSDSGATSVEPASGKKLWEYQWQTDGRILQPALLGDGDLLLSAENKSVRRVVASQVLNEWTTKDIWTNSQMKVNFNDFVIHKGYAYGFDGPCLVCVDLSDGKRIWRGDRYRGFLLLLADQDLLLILSEKGELALVPADPKKFTELFKFQGIKGKTWNHPVLVGNLLVIRNAQEMAAFRLPLIK
jgi:outer membrane protein assembly factor BamB